MLTYDNSHPGGLRARRRQVLASYGHEKASFGRHEAQRQSARRRILYTVTALAAVVVLLELAAVFILRL